MANLGEILGAVIAIAAGGAGALALHSTRTEAYAALDSGDLDGYEGKLRDLGVLIEGFRAMGVEPPL